jgi:hypothetical protein
MNLSLGALPGESTVYFAIRAKDEVNNQGGLSNSPWVTTPGIAPGVVTNLAASNGTTTGFTVSFKATGDDGSAGTATTYDVRCSTSLLSEANWATASVMGGEPSPKAAGLDESFGVTGSLQADTTYYVGIKVADEVGNWSGLSNVATMKTADVVLPSAITNLGASVASLGTVKVSGVTGTSSSDYSATYVAGMAVDGSTGSHWSSLAAGVAGEETLTLNLGSSRKVGKVRLMPRATYYQGFPRDFVIEVSVDGTNYVTAHTETGYVAANGVWCERTFTAKDGQYVRLRAQRVSVWSGYYVQVSEMEVYEELGTVAQLSWTAPGDNGSVGTATSYDIRYSTSGAITDEAKWSSASQVSGEPAPAVAGTTQGMSVPLSALGSPTTGTPIYFCIRAKDEANLQGGVSNSPSVTAP